MLIRLAFSIRAAIGFKTVLGLMQFAFCVVIYHRQRDIIIAKETTSVRIGGAAGYWGDSAMATPQFLREGGVDYIIFDYLAEITMSILARAKAKDPNAGYAADFVSTVLSPHIGDIAKQGVKIIANAGGLNPLACAKAAEAAVGRAGLSLKVAAVTGDDLMARLDDIASTEPTDEYSGAPFPPKDDILSANAYLGAFPIAEALANGADIVITGRCVDSALALGPLIHEFGWARSDFDALASGSLAGHILECGAQATGGNFTDWRAVENAAEIGYPIAEIEKSGAFTVYKPARSGGLVSRGTVAEQLVYEIGDPQAYRLPDVSCDFSDVAIIEEAPGRVRVSGARGRAAPSHYKTCVTYRDGFRTGLYLTFYGFDASEKAAHAADAILERARSRLRSFNAADFSEVSVEILGAESQYGDFKEQSASREVILKLAVKHPDALGAGLILKEAAGFGLAAPPGISSYAGARPKPSPVVRLFTTMTAKSDIQPAIHMDGGETAIEEPQVGGALESEIESPAPPPAPTDCDTEVPLIKLAWARSGDKGDKANIGVIAREPAFLPYIYHALSEDVIAKRFGHFIKGGADPSKVTRYFWPGPLALNIVIDEVLGGGGVASLRNDPQGKGYAQLLLACPIPVPASIAEALA
ncbi:MAG: acyclic terpene utilization AtuA family protein [Pseudomonadota bacterium]